MTAVATEDPVKAELQHARKAPAGPRGVMQRTGSPAAPSALGASGLKHRDWDEPGSWLVSPAVLLTGTNLDK